MSEPAVVSIIVPVLDEERALPGLLDHLASLSGSFEVILADGGSTDGTVDVARGHAQRPLVVAAALGRASQCNAGAAAAAGAVLLFLHADTRLPGSAHSGIVSALADPRVVGGNFALSFDGGDPMSRVLGAWYAVQRRLGVYYGDSAIWVRASAFRELGGFRPLAIMEDYDFVRHLERHGRTRCLPGPAITSARRWKRLGVLRTVTAWVVIRWLFLAGVSPTRLARLYPHAR